MGHQCQCLEMGVFFLEIGLVASGSTEHCLTHFKDFSVKRKLVLGFSLKQN